MRLGLKLSAAAAAISLLLVGCSSEPELEPTVTPTQTQSATAEPEPEPEPVYEVAPLTGVSYLEGENQFLALPAVSAKIDNTSSGRPQLSLNDADIVYVTRVEVGLSRLLPVWHSRMPEVIGPVRSVRPVDAAIIDPYHGVFVYSGGQAPFKNAVKQTGLEMSDEDTEMNNDSYFREDSRVAPWNLMFNAQQLQQLYAAEQPAPEASLMFSGIPTAVEQGVPVTALRVKYPGIQSDWELGTATFPWALTQESAWLRTQDQKEHLQQGGDRVVAKNVVVLEVVHDLSFVDPKYGAIPKAKLESNQGIAHIFSDGHYIQGAWSKSASQDPILLNDESGQPILLAIGNTWIEMMDVPTSKLSITEPETASE